MENNIISGKKSITDVMNKKLGPSEAWQIKLLKQAAKKSACGGLEENKNFWQRGLANQTVYTSSKEKCLWRAGEKQKTAGPKRLLTDYGHWLTSGRKMKQNKCGWVKLTTASRPKNWHKLDL